MEEPVDVVTLANDETPFAVIATVDLPDGGQCNVWVFTDDPHRHTVEASYRPDHSATFGPPLPVLVEYQGD